MEKHAPITVVATALCLLCACRSPNEVAVPPNSLPRQTSRVLEKGQRFILLSLDPVLPPMFSGPGRPEETFHGYSVLGEAEIRDPKERVLLLRELYSGIEQAGGDVPKCFNPRHGIRAISGNETVDLVICFQCFQIQTHASCGRDVLTSRSPESAFDRALERAGLPIAKYPGTNLPPNPFE